MRVMRLSAMRVRQTRATADMPGLIEHSDSEENQVSAYVAHGPWAA